MVKKRIMPKKKEKNDTSPGKGVPPKKKNNYSKFMQKEIFMKEEIKEEGEEKKMKIISAQQMAKRKEKGMQRLQAFQNKKQSEELAMGMIARNEALDQLGLKVNEEEIMSERAAREQAETSWRSPPPLSSGYPSRSPSPESRVVLQQEERRRREEERSRHVKESPRLVAQIGADRAHELARARNATNHLRRRRAREILSVALRAPWLESA